MNNRFLHINILDHPSNRNKTVFFFTEDKHAEYFRELISVEGIPFEYQFDEEESKHYFGFRKQYESQVRKLNFLVFAKFRKPFISSAFFKYTLLLVTSTLIILAAVGYFTTH